MCITFQCTLISIVLLGSLGINTSKKVMLPLHSSSFLNLIYRNVWLICEKIVFTSICYRNAKQTLF